MNRIQQSLNTKHVNKVIVVENSLKIACLGAIYDILGSSMRTKRYFIGTDIKRSMET